MNTLRRSLLGLYQATTRGARRRALERRCRVGNAPVCVLFYHRIADTHPSDWTLSVADFRRQLDWLGQRFDFVSLGEAQSRLTGGANHRPAVSITFDDGYGENCDAAIPLLVERRIPTTYFVATRFVQNQTPFPHDVKAGAPLRPNTISELRAMADAGVEIGAHTRTHADLGDPRNADRIEDELLGSIDDLEAWLGRRPRYFAFPYGLPENLSPAAMALARRAGIEGVCSAYGAYNLPEHVSDSLGPFHLRRIHGDPDWQRFANWMTFDPRRMAADGQIDDDAYLPVEPFPRLAMGGARA